MSNSVVIERSKLRRKNLKKIIIILKCHLNASFRSGLIILQAEVSHTVIGSTRDFEYVAFSDLLMWF